MKRVAIIGSGHLGQQIAHHIHTDTEDVVVGYFDEYQKIGQKVNNIIVLGGNNDVENAYENNIFDEVLIAIGYKHMNVRKELFEQLSPIIPFYTFIHSKTYVDFSAKIGKGTIIYPGCIIDQSVTIQENVLINISSCIAHDSIIGKHSFLSPAIAIAGFVNIGEQCVIGINATIIDNISIEDKVQIGAGTVVTKKLDKVGLYVGIPAKFIK
ncbi:acetyltransferase [Elizabethkingia anophelis]|uniref:acetyltransferase n=1 Tax=Elizabethkingia TaxID=308865 RepID=UPI001366701A|nr:MULTISPECIES: acetyltransferase [Elizabethkingia]MCT3670090.1 acetyltransferase [Elizabethkingia anophelis]MCT3689421.1 acetyltransferase [Elizabethkingia anophelis]MCT3706489.1 acetyltransferase [Elizabethkingia anophelis]MCT3713508.1 acetyltransferase [Elizabethkingia anophelis]MCT3716927.1 acetyltransferase [Elizabethkingia anophelis]